jgi:hypothetical protein
MAARPEAATAARLQGAERPGRLAAAALPAAATVAAAVNSAAVKNSKRVPGLAAGTRDALRRVSANMAKQNQPASSRKVIVGVIIVVVAAVIAWVVYFVGYTYIAYNKPITPPAPISTYNDSNGGVQGGSPAMLVSDIEPDGGAGENGKTITVAGFIVGQKPSPNGGGQVQLIADEANPKAADPMMMITPVQTVAANKSYKFTGVYNAKTHTLTVSSAK